MNSTSKDTLKYHCEMGTMSDKNQDELSGIASDGHKKMRARVSEQQAREDKQKRRHAAWGHLRYRSRLVASMLPISYLSGFPTFFVIILFVIMMCLGLGAMETMVLGQITSFCLLCVFLSLPLWVWLYARRRVTREQAWVESLPFRLEKYPHILGGKSYKTVELDLQFSETSPSQQLLGDLVAAAKVPTRLLSMEGSQAEIEVTFRRGSKIDEQRAWLRGWTHQFVASVLIPLHRQYPVEFVRFPEPYGGD